jgi:hypothetical protein
LVQTVETVVCVVCGKTHLETPPKREDGEFHHKDWGYYRDNWNGVYSVICKKEHDQLVAPKGEVVK